MLNEEVKQENLQQPTQTQDPANNIQGNEQEQQNNNPEGVNTQTQQDNNVEENNENNQGNKDIQQPNNQQPTVDELQNRLKEYELTETEMEQLKNRLGIEQVDYTTAQVTQTLDIINNQAQQEYIKLCNKFGVDYRPDKIDESAKELENTNPKAYWELRASLERLHDYTESRKSEVINYAVAKEVNSFYNDNRPILEASPVINSVVNEYINTTPIEMLNRQSLNTFMDRVNQIYAEAFNAGLKMGKAKETTDPNKILNSSIMSNKTSTYNMGKPYFTKEQIARMSTEEFARNEKEIMSQMAQGLIS